ncbi:MAG: NUDIX hydrolase [bacterium]
MIAIKKPVGFVSTFGAVGCFVMCKGEMLLLERLEKTQEKSEWGLPGGKIDGSESPREAMKRELYEETGISCDAANFQYVAKVYVTQRSDCFEFSIFSLTYAVRPRVIIDLEEHTDFGWVIPREAEDRRLMEALPKCMRIAGLLP